jgi:hypothetical protein
MRLTSSLAFAAVLTGAASASAFCRTTTTPISPEFTPTVDQPCWTDGLPLYWRNACVGFDVQQGASRQVSYDQAVQAMTAAFAKWKGATCPTINGASNISIDVRYLGPVACDRVEYNTNTSVPNANVIIFRDDSWPHDDPNNTLALTTVTYNPTTGELYDADMEINTAQHNFTLSDPVPPDGFDFASAVTHESGHFLGLAHTPDDHATMFARYTQGATTMRNLAADDVSGICSVYLPDGTHATSTGPTPEAACDPTPRHGFGSTCGSDAKSGCSMAGEAGGSWAFLLVLGAGFIGLGRARKRA